MRSGVSSSRALERRAGLPAALGVALLCLGAGAGALALGRELLIVVQRETALRADKKLLSAKVATVREGDQVARLATDGSWYRVEFQGQEGWLPQSAVSSDRKVVLSSQAIAGGVRATEQSAGARGFNPQVEARHRSSRTDLEAAYRLVDRIQETRFSEERVSRFAREGKLGEALAAAQPPAASPASPSPGSTSSGSTSPGSTARQPPPWKR